MNQVSLPKTTLNILPASTPVSNVAQKVLIVGAKTAAGTATSGELKTAVQIGDINTFFGLTSMVAQMARAFKAINDKSQLDVIALDDAGGGVAASGSFILASGPATEAGTLTFNIGSEQNNSYPVPVAIGDTITDVGDALDALILADTDSPFTSSNAAGDITITAENKGTVGNLMGLEVSGTVAGITHSVVAMNGGATDPTLTTLFDPIDGIRYQTIVYPGSWAIATLKTLLQARFNVDNLILDGMAIIGFTDTRANLVTKYNGDNEEQITVLGNKIVTNTSYKGSANFEFDDVIASEWAAIRSLRLTDDVSIASFTVAGTNGARDSFGGDAIRSLPYFNTPMANIPVANIGLGFTDAELTLLNAAGVSVIGPNVARNSTIMGEMVTTYKTDAAGNSDTSFKYTNFVDTMSGIREYFFNNLKSRFAQSRLTTGEVLPRRNMANEKIIRGYCKKLYNDLAGEDFVLTQLGETALNFYNDNLTITLDLSARKATITMKTPIVTQLANIVGSIQLSFTTN
jgi:phage tail sheath gpL-like